MNGKMIVHTKYYDESFGSLRTEVSVRTTHPRHIRCSEYETKNITSA